MKVSMASSFQTLLTPMQDVLHESKKNSPFKIRQSVNLRSADDAPAKVCLANPSWWPEEAVRDPLAMPAVLRCEAPLVQARRESSDGESRCASPASSQDEAAALGSDGAGQRRKSGDATTASTCTADAASDSGADQLLDCV